MDKCAQNVADVQADNIEIEYGVIPIQNRECACTRQAKHYRGYLSVPFKYHVDIITDITIFWANMDQSDNVVFSDVFRFMGVGYAVNKHNGDGITVILVASEVIKG